MLGDSFEENMEEDLEEEPGQNIRIEKKKLEEIEGALRVLEEREKEVVKKDKNIER